MVLLQTVQGAITQVFGVSALQVEPSMFFDVEKAYWADSLHGHFPGSSFSANFHPGIDRGAPTGTAVRAMEAGTVSFSGWKDNISGAQVEVQINDRCWFSVNHLSKRNVSVGDRVSQGQIIGLVGTTGATTGPHVHEGLSIFEQDSDGIGRTFLYNAALFHQRAKYQNDPRVQPTERYFCLNGLGINIRKVPISFDQPSDVWGRTMDPIGKSPGIYRLSTGNRRGPVDKVFHYLRTVDTAEGDFLVGTAFRQKLAVRKSLTHWTDREGRAL